jgi:thioredoxin reductase (NADPH)
MYLKKIKQRNFSMFDIAIIGTGPAGLSAALTLTSLGKNFIWFGNRNFSEKIRKAEMIRNFPGLSSVSGEEMKNAFDKQIADIFFA